MTKAQLEVFEALNPFFEVVMEGLRGLVDGDHYFDTFFNLWFVCLVGSALEPAATLA
ncbi:MAG: hypothetical protein WB630_00040 [Candidatus Acidiferrales bacterium]